MKACLSAVCKIFLLFGVMLIHLRGSSQSLIGVPRVAILAPLYIDSAFDNTTYKLGSTSMPRYILPGLEFYNGAMLAIDSIKKSGRSLDVWVFDTKKKNLTVDALAKEMESLQFSLVIAAFSNLTEQKRFAEFAFSNNVPLVSATYPNDAYVSGNPFFIMLNSTLKTHIEGIYKQVQRMYPVGKFLLVTRKGNMEERILDMFADAGKKTYPIKYKTVELPDNFTEDQLLPLLDSNDQNIVICGSLDENFSTNLIKTLDRSATFPVTLVGSPTWDGLRAVVRTGNANLSILYSTPFNYIRTDKTIAGIAAKYRQKLNARPGDMALKGYESMFYFSNLLLQYNKDFLNNLSDPKYRIANAYNLQPVKLQTSAQIPDYIENKKLYFITRSLGKITAVN
ncbi:hypothetical protein I5907_16245 [Panacibacter sp. DH6]|uniref:Amino acid ABC transporter substrate-binding protein n=1 Tax=Panacibacter microcysteis TaxID=2793269 RepID=A0A931E7T9_9BACT|nr:hypothetical protein [Panacibacter microcysteis]MBG9377792.1 hypothetical protein [Panacibacter microcysteis]